MRLLLILKLYGFNTDHVHSAMEFMSLQRPFPEAHATLATCDWGAQVTLPMRSWRSEDHNQPSAELKSKPSIEAVSKLQPTGQAWLAACFCKSSFPGAEPQAEGWVVLLHNQQQHR